jgi:hypothetical protein
MSRFRVMLAVATSVVVVVVLALGLGPAYASRVVRLGSHISIKSTSAGTFSGKVTSSNAACDRGRKVTLYTTTSLKLGSKTTSASGAWKITPSGFAGISLHHFYAKVAQESQGTAGTIYVCKAAKSRAVPF